MWKRLTKPFGTGTEYNNKQTEFLTGFLLIYLIVGIIAGIIYVIWSDSADRPGAIMGSGAAIFLLLVPYLISRTRFYYIAAIATVMIFNLLAIVEYRETASLASLATMAVPVFLAALLAPFWLAAIVAMTNGFLALFIPLWTFAIPLEEARSNGTGSILFVMALSFLVAIQYKRVSRERHDALLAKEEALLASQAQLEERVEERTAALQVANESLRLEIDERKAIEKRLQERDKQLGELTQQVIHTQEEERRRMSRELHDAAGQALTALRFKLAIIRDRARLSNMNGEYAHNLPYMLDEAVERVDQVMGGIRALAHGLRPAALDDLGLHPALEGLCADFANQTGLKISYEGVQSPPLTEEIEITLYRFLQEALNNVARHADAEEVLVRLVYDDASVFLSVTDNGKGFDPAYVARQIPSSQRGIGLIGLQERLHAQGGKLELFSQPGEGTHLTARVPRPVELESLPIPTTISSVLKTDSIRVVIAEDHHVVRTAVAEWLNREDDIQVVGEVDDGANLLPVVEALQPHVLMLDVQMPNQRATEAVIAIRERFPSVRILIFSAYNRPEYVLSLVTAGVKGYVLKDDAPQTVLQAIRSVAAGKTWLTPRVVNELQEGNGRHDDSPIETLTPREMDVLQLMVDGKSNEDIASILVVTPQAIRNLASSIYRKLGVGSRVEAVLAAMRLGIEPSPTEVPGNAQTQSPSPDVLPSSG